MSKQSTLQTLQDIELPQSVIESFARFLVPEIRKYYESEEGQREFEQWQRQQDNSRQAALPPLRGSL